MRRCSPVGRGWREGEEGSRWGGPGRRRSGGGGPPGGGRPGKGPGLVWAVPPSLSRIRPPGPLAAPIHVRRCPRRPEQLGSTPELNTEAAGPVGGGPVRLQVHGECGGHPGLRTALPCVQAEGRGTRGAEGQDSPSLPHTSSGHQLPLRAGGPAGRGAAHPQFWAGRRQGPLVRTSGTHIRWGPAMSPTPIGRTHLRPSGRPPPPATVQPWLLGAQLTAAPGATLRLALWPLCRAHLSKRAGPGFEWVL